MYKMWRQKKIVFITSKIYTSKQTRGEKRALDKWDNSRGTIKMNKQPWCITLCKLCSSKKKIIQIMLAHH